MKQGVEAVEEIQDSNVNADNDVNMRVSPPNDGKFKARLIIFVAKILKDAPMTSP